MGLKHKLKVGAVKLKKTIAKHPYIAAAVAAPVLLAMAPILPAIVETGYGASILARKDRRNAFLKDLAEEGPKLAVATMAGQPEEAIAW